MHNVLGRYSEWFYAAMRVFVGALFLLHGVQKLFGVLGMKAPVTDPELIAAGIIELVCGSLIVLGLWVGYAAFIASGEMAIAYFKVHAPNGFWPLLNSGERAVFYCFVFLYMSAKGSGSISLDRLLWRKRRPA